MQFKPCKVLEDANIVLLDALTRCARQIDVQDRLIRELLFDELKLGHNTT